VTLAEFELMVMVAALRLDDDAHAVSIAADIGERTGRILTVLRRPLMQLTLGAIAGAPLTVGLAQLMELPIGFSLSLVAFSPVIFAVCLLACVVPARHALHVDPIAALRAE